MATRRSTIEVEVLGLAQLQSLNTALGTHDRRLQALTATYIAFNAAVNAANPQLQRFGNTFVTVNNTVNNANRTFNTTTNNITNMGNAANRAGGMFGGMLGVMLRYRAVSLVFEGVEKAIGATVQAMYDMEKQAARVQRVSAPGSTPGIRADFAVEAARTGADIKDIGEAYYQLKTQIKDNAAAFSALQTTMNLVVGTESDARDTTRAMLQVYNQFGDELGKNVDQAEKMRRAGELLAVMWKGSSAEVGEITQSLKYLGPIAELAKVSLTQVAGVITGLTAEGVRGRMGGTGTAQFLLQLVQHLDASTGMITNKGASAKAFIDANTGALDLLRTIQNVVEVGKRLPVEQQQKYYLAISDSKQAARFLGAVNENALKIITKAADDATKATHGLTHETDDLRKTMTTTAQEGQRAFGGLFAFIANTVNLNPIRGWLHGIADDIQHVLDAQRTAQGFLDQQQAYSARVLAPGANVRLAVEHTRETVRKALDQAVNDPDRGTLSEGLFTRPLDNATAGMNQAQREMIRGRYYDPANPLHRLNEDKMRRDLATMDAQLADPHFGLAPAANASGGSPSGATGLGLRGLSREQLENAAIIAEVAKRHNIDPLALIAASYAESNLNARDVNPTSGATGLFQFLRSTRPDINRLDARANAEAAAHEITTRMSGHGAIPPGLSGTDAARWIIENFERPGAAGVRGDMSRVTEFYRKHVGGGANLGGYDDPKIAKAAEEAAKQQQAILDQKAQTAQIEFEHAKKLFEEGKIGESAVVAAARRADALSAAAGDPNERLKLRYGLTGNVAALSDDREKSAEEAKKDRESEAEKRRDLYRAGGPEGGLARVPGYVPILGGFPIPKEAIEAFQGRPEVKKAVEDAKNAAEARAKAEEEFAKSGAEGMDQVRKSREDWEKQDAAYADRITAQTDASIRARELGLRPNMMGGGSDARQEGIFTGNIADLQASLDLLKKNVPGASDQINQMAARLAEANAALTDFHDTLDQKAYSKRVQAEQDAYELRNQEINHLHRLKFFKDQDAAEKDTVAKLSELVGSAEQQLATVKGHPLTDKTEEEKRKAQKDVEEARQNLVDYQMDTKIQKYQTVYGDVKSTVHGAFMDFFHGKGDVGTVAERIGGSIVDAALDAQIKRFTDPLVQTVTSEILAIQGNTDALTLLNSTMGGGGSTYGTGAAKSGVGAAVAAGVAAAFDAGPGASDYGWGPVQTAGTGGGSAKGPQRQSDLQKGVGAALAAYSIGATSAQQGVNAGNLLGGIASGASIGATFGGAGALIGGAIGGVVDLIGGLFHHNNTPTATPQDLNPAYYNAPSNFDVAAYNYSAYGKLPRMQDVGFDVNAAKAPIVNVYVDGAKVAARQEISRQTTLATVSLTNPAMDRHSPV